MARYVAERRSAPIIRSTQLILAEYVDCGTRPRPLGPLGQLASEPRQTGRQRAPDAGPPSQWRTDRPVYDERPIATRGWLYDIHRFDEGVTFEMMPLLYIAHVAPSLHPISDQ
jgi:hypothetical protein